MKKRTLDRMLLGVLAEMPAIVLCVAGAQHFGLSLWFAIPLGMTALWINNIEMGSRRKQ